MTVIQKYYIAIFKSDVFVNAKYIIFISWLRLLLGCVSSELQMCISHSLFKAAAVFIFAAQSSFATVQHRWRESPEAPTYPGVWWRWEFSSNAGSFRLFEVRTKIFPWESSPWTLRIAFLGGCSFVPRIVCFEVLFCISVIYVLELCLELRCLSILPRFCLSPATPAFEGKKYLRDQLSRLLTPGKSLWEGG